MGESLSRPQAPGAGHPPRLATAPSGATAVRPCGPDGPFQRSFACTVGLDPVEAELLAAVRKATAMPFVDPVPVHGRLMSRRDARTIERVLVKLGKSQGRKE